MINSFWGWNQNENNNYKNGGARLSVNIGNKINFNAPLNFWMGAGFNEIVLKIQKLMEKRAPQNGWFVNPFFGIYWYPCCCLTLFPPSVGFYIMGYESEPLPSQIFLNKCSCTLNIKMSSFISWSLYLPSHVLIPPLYTSVNSFSPCWPCA